MISNEVSNRLHQASCQRLQKARQITSAQQGQRHARGARKQPSVRAQT